MFFFRKKIGVSQFMVVFPYVSLSWLEHQESACKYKLKNIKYTCIEWFFAFFPNHVLCNEEDSLIIHLSIFFVRNIFIWSLEILCFIARIMSRERKENGKSKNQS